MRSRNIWTGRKNLEANIRTHHLTTTIPGKFFSTLARITREGPFYSLEPSTINPTESPTGRSTATSILICLNCTSKTIWRATLISTS